MQSVVNLLSSGGDLQRGEDRFVMLQLNPGVCQSLDPVYGEKFITRQPIRKGEPQQRFFGIQCNQEVKVRLPLTYRCRFRSLIKGGDREYLAMKWTGAVELELVHRSRSLGSSAVLATLCRNIRLHHDQ
jgi:hypothetical protein